MDVRCERCSTDYDFDDALLSERGTTVKCTTCGHKFRIFPTRVTGAMVDRWTVLPSEPARAAGAPLVFTSLRELQAAITAGRVRSSDRLIRGEGPPRPLTAIAELEPFFAAVPPSSSNADRTLTGVAPPAAGSVVPPSVLPPPMRGSVPRTASKPPAGSKDTLRMGVKSRQPESVSTSSEPGRSASNRSFSTTQPLVSFPSENVVRPQGNASVQALARTLPDDGEPATRMRSNAPPEHGDSPVPTQVAPTEPALHGRQGHGADSLVSPTQVAPTVAAPTAPPISPDPMSPEPATRVADTRPTTQLLELPMSSTPSQAPGRRPELLTTMESRAGTGLLTTMESRSVAPPNSDPFQTPATGSAPLPESRLPSGVMSDPRYAPNSRRLQTRWIVGVVLLGLAVLLAATVGRRALEQYATPASTDDAQIGTLVAEGDAELARGQLDAASERYLKAAGRAESAPVVKRALAQLELVRADHAWLALRLVDGADTATVALRQRELATRLERADRALESLGEDAEGAAERTRLRLDALRLHGRLAEARALSLQLASLGSDPRDAYPLAALDLAEPEAPWAAVAERLARLARTEGALGRARAALTYALARAGKLAEAKAEYARLLRSEPPHPLAEPIAAFLRRLGAEVESTPSGSAAASAGSAAPGAGTSSAAPPHGPTTATGTPERPLRGAHPPERPSKPPDGTPEKSPETPPEKPTGGGAPIPPPPAPIPPPPAPIPGAPDQ